METIEGPPYRISIPIEGLEFFVSADSVIAALGQIPDVNAISDLLGSLDKTGNRTALENVFAAGDFVIGSSDVISAVAGGKRCAKAVDEFLTGFKRKQIVVRQEEQSTTDRPRSFDFIGRTEMNTLDMEDRLSIVLHLLFSLYRCGAKGLHQNDQ